jgi:hypothetical protein
MTGKGMQPAGIACSLRPSALIPANVKTDKPPNEKAPAERIGEGSWQFPGGKKVSA